MSVAIEIEERGLSRALAAIDRLATLPGDELLDIAGALGESQTRRRIEEEKTSPAGIPWRPNRAGTSILLDTGRNLRDSIGFAVGGGEVRWGASWGLAPVHQFGKATKPHRITPRTKKALAFNGLVRAAVNHPGSLIPPRPFIGLSMENEVEIIQVIEDVIARRLGEAA